MKTHASHFRPNRYPSGQVLDSWCVQWGTSEKGLVFATHINIENEQTQALCAWEQNEPSLVAKDTWGEKRVSQEEKKRCHSCFLMLMDCWILQVDSGHVGIDQSNRGTGWSTCPRVVLLGCHRQWKFCNRSMESTMSTCLVLRDINFLVRMLVGYVICRG